jgi:hypothetical protein
MTFGSGSAANDPPGNETKPGVDPTTTGSRQDSPETDAGGVGEVANVGDVAGEGVGIPVD